MENLSKPQPATPESVWILLQENAIQLRELRESNKELRDSQKETDRQMKETDRKMQETDRQMKETACQMKETDRIVKELSNKIGGMANNQGAFAEEYFINSFKNGKTNFFGENFDEIAQHLKNRWQGVEDEYDIVLYNHASAAIIEVKYKAHLKNIPAVLNKAETFRILFPQYKDFKIYLGLASMSFFPELEQECIEQGIAVIKQVGDKVVINDSNLKVF